MKIEKVINNIQRLYIMKISIQLNPLKQAIIASIIAILLLFATNKLRAQAVVNKVTFEPTLEYIVNFNEVATKEGVKSPNSQPLLYCFIIDDTTTSDRIFRVKITSREEVTYSNLLDFSSATDQTLVNK